MTITANTVGLCGAASGFSVPIPIFRWVPRRPTCAKVAGAVSSNGFVLLLTLGAAALALWFDHQFPNLSPRSLSGAVLAVIATGIALNLTLPFAVVLIRGPFPLVPLIGIIGLILPALALTFLSAVWVIKVAVSALGGGIR